jgi:hypothetical protein
MDVPPTATWQILLFEHHWPLTAALACVAVTLAVVGNRRAQRSLWVAAGVVAASSVASVVTARVVTTDRETLTAHLDAALDATVPYDDAAFGALLAPRAVLTDERGGAYLPKPLWRIAFGRVFGESPIERHRVVQWDVGVSSPVSATGELRLSTWMQESPGVPHRTGWGLKFARDTPDDAWALSELRCLSYNGQDPSFVLGFLGSGRR